MINSKPLGIAIGAGLASALLFAASAKGAGLALFIAYVTPLPIMIAALGFGHATGLLAAGVAFGGLAIVLGFLPAVFFALLLGFPSWWLAYLALLGRPLLPSPGAPRQPNTIMLWYPVGRIATWAVGLVAGVILVLGGVLLLRYGGFSATVTLIAGRLDEIVGSTTSSDLSSTTTARSLVQLLPVLTAASAFLMLLVNLWLAARIVQRSGLLSRPWPSVPENLRLPRITVAALACGALAVAFHGAPRVAGGVVIASLGMAFVLQGLGTAHVLTRGLAARRIILVSIYFITFTVVPSLVALAVLGVVDSLFPLRHRPISSPLPPSK